MTAGWSRLEMYPCETMNTAQQIYMLFFAVLYGSHLNSIGNFRPFQWRFWVDEQKIIRKMLLRRLCWGLVIFNLIPMVIFSVQFFLWGKLGYNLKDHSAFIYSFIAGLSAVAAFLPYRFYHWLFCMGYQKLCQKEIVYAGYKNSWIIYTWQEYVTIINQRKMEPRPWVQGWAVVFYVLLPLCCHLVPWLIAKTTDSCQPSPLNLGV